MNKIVKVFQVRLREVEQKIPNDKSREWENWKKDPNRDFQFTHWPTDRKIEELQWLADELTHARDLLEEAKEMAEDQEDARAFRRVVQTIGQGWRNK